MRPIRALLAAQPGADTPGGFLRAGLRRPLLALLLAAGTLAACATPPSTSYVAANFKERARGAPAGNNARGESCLVQAGRVTAADATNARAQEVFCGGWTQPAARLVALDGASISIDSLAAGGLWRSELSQRFNCGAPTSTTITGGRRALLMACTRRAGGWPHVAMAIEGPKGPVLADGLASSVPVIERLATGQAADATTGSRSAALELAVARLSAESFGANDINQYDSLMELGRDLNRIDNFAGAEQAYRAALAAQERSLGVGNPNTVTPMVHLALNLSAEGRYTEADALFRRAEVLTPEAADPTARARLLHYQGLHILNRGDNKGALAMLQQADTAYAALLPASLLQGGVSDGVGAGLVTDPVSQTATAGLAEVRRMQGVVLAREGQPDQALAMISNSRALLQRAGFTTGAMLDGRALRTESRADRRGSGDAAALLQRASQRFAQAAPGERPEAVTLFLLGNDRLREKSVEDALAAFRAGAAILRSRQISLTTELVMPYLDALAAQGGANPSSELLVEMFGAAQLAQRSNTVRFVQQATARLGASGGDARVAGAVRALQDADRELRGLFADRDLAGEADRPALDQRIAAAQQKRSDAEEEVAAAAPGYRQLALASVGAPDVQRVLAPGEALVTMLLGPKNGYVFLLKPEGLFVARTALTDGEAARQVDALRESAAPQSGAAGPGKFDFAAANGLYNALFGSFAKPLEGVKQLVVAPDGALLSLPFGMLLTEATDPAADMGKAPWLIRRYSLVHVPGPQTLVSLRAVATGSAGNKPYLGFGDFVPPTTAQLNRAFPVETCGKDAVLATGLGRLPGTRGEVQIAADITGGGAASTLLGPAFTAEAMKHAGLGQARIIHLATHALLPGELSCLTEPTILASLPANAQDAKAAFVTASDILSLKLDADLVILSACNTGGPGGAGGGEALSGLARAFFYAGARGLMVTHWAVDDYAASVIVAYTLNEQKGGKSSADALRAAQLLLLDGAGHGELPAAFAHPYYWAPFALVGDGLRIHQNPGARVAARL